MRIRLRCSMDSLEISIVLAPDNLRPPPVLRPRPPDLAGDLDVVLFLG